MDNNIASNNLIFSVSELSHLLKETIEGGFYNIKVKGEISGLKTNYSSGYYFDLKDEYAKLKCIIFKSDIRKIRCEIEDGLSVTAYGRIGLYEPRGEYSFIISELKPSGYGELYILFERLKDKLKKEGLFDDSHKRKIPFMPETIGVVTSKNGAVLHDIVKVIESRFENVSIILANASVQGKNSSTEIVAAIELLNLYGKTQRKIDVIIVGRGGGSIEDLWSFNEEITARAIYNSAIPVISAVGHETDFTIADFTADRRASTPSNAAEMVVPVKFELIKQLKTLRGRIEQGIFNIVSTKKSNLFNLIENRDRVSPKRLIQDKMLRVYDMSERTHKVVSGRIDSLKVNVSHLNKRLSLKNPSTVFNESRVYVAGLSERLKNAAGVTILNCKNRLQTESKALSYLSPYNVLRRGYGIVFTDKDEVVSSVLNVEDNENIKIALSDGSLNATVNGKEFNEK